MNTIFKLWRNKKEDKMIYVNSHRKSSFTCLEDYLNNYSDHWGTIEDFWQGERSVRDILLADLAHSRYYRRLMQQRDSECLFEMLIDEAPSLKKYVNMDMFANYLKTCKEEMSDYEIVRLPCDATIEVNGLKYHGAVDLKNAWHQKRIENRWEGFPCFDSYDYADENRCYNNYCFCEKDSDIWKKVQELEEKCDFCLVNEHMPTDVLPMVYVNDESPTMLFAHF